MIKVMVVDDEAPARERMVRLIACNPGFKVVAQASDGVEALHLLEEHAVDILFLDIDMPRKNGIEVALELADQNTPPQVVFVTAHDEFAVKAFEAHAIDYVLKPFDEERIEKTFKKIKEAVRFKRLSGQEWAAFGDDYASKVQKIVGRRVNSKERILIDPADVFYFHANLAMVVACLGDKEWNVTLTLDELERSLGPAHFARSHRAYLVNLAKVEKVVPMFNENYELVLKDNAHTHIPLARRNAKEFKKKLGNW
ncbi:MAG: LytTR family DNA-binding domain-containing protein [Candidatus Omnitrophota bacterium]